MIPLSVIEEFRSVASDFEEIVWKNESKFVHNFCAFSDADLIDIRFCSERIVYVYTNHEGQSVVDSTTWPQFQNFIWSVKND